MGTKTPRSLEGYMKDKRRAECPVCQLSDEIREQIATASAKKIRRKDQIEWLQQEIGVDVTARDLDTHYFGRHNQ